MRIDKNLLSFIFTQMGNSQQTTKKKPHQQQQSINHPKFTNKQTLIAETDSQILQTLQISVTVANMQEYSQWRHHFEKFNESRNRDALLLPIKHQFKKQGYCGSSGIVQLSFENYPFLLSDQISNRGCLNDKNFQMNELWYLVYTLISAGSTFHSAKQKIGDVRPQNLLISEDGSVKIANKYSWPNENDNYWKTFYQKEPTYLAPEQIKEVTFGKPESSEDFELAETFSIGLCCLDAALLENSLDLYTSNRKFNYELLENKIKQLEEHPQYSPTLKTIIINMCSVDCMKRETCQVIFQWLQPYEEYNNQFCDFEIQQKPTKIRNTFEQHMKKQLVEIHQKGPSEYYVPPANFRANPNLPPQFTNFSSAINSYNSEINTAQVSRYVSQTVANQASENNRIISQPTSTFTFGNNNQSAIQGQIKDSQSFNKKDNSQFSINKIDEQFFFSRKMFPS